MDQITAQNLFAVRLYEWSQRDLARELEEGCPLLSTLGLNARWVAAFVSWNETLSSRERKALAIALTRQCHENAARLKGEASTKEDERWDRLRYEQTKIRMESLPPLTSADRNDPAFEPVDPDQCLDHLVRCLSPVMGRVSRRKSKDLCVRKIGDWKIVTELTFDRKGESLSFEYHFSRKDGGPAEEPHPAQGPFPRTMLFFYGLGFSTVDVPSHVDSEPMAKAMANLAEYFVAKADPLFAGLGVND